MQHEKNIMNHLSVRPFAVPDADAYKIGDRDDRPWGHYVVTAAGRAANDEEYCEKIITVRPGHILSLQSHNMRRETWTVKKGILTALCDGRRVEVFPHQSIYIPAGSIHCMANLEEDDCIVEERQEGVCREEDIKRYMDAYQRNTEAASPMAAESIAIYRAILSDINKIYESRVQSGSY